MKKNLTKFISTIMLVGALNGLTSCVNHDAGAKGSVKKDYHDWYSSESQISQIVDALDANNDRIISYNPDKNNASIRLAHGEGKPIEVAFHPSFNGLEGYAIDSLDYLFGLIGEINNDYKYEVVDFKSVNDHNIVFQAKESSDKYAGTTSISSRGADDGVHNIEWGIVTIYKDAIQSIDKISEEKELNLRNTITHEIMHVLGFDDVYANLTDMYFGNTILHTSSKGANNFAQLHLTPNDYKNLIALYAKPSNNLENDIKKYKAMSENYTINYYHNWLFSEFENEKPPLESLNKQETYTFSQKSLSETSATQELDFCINVNDDKYNLTVSDKSGKILEQTSGDVTYISTNISSDGKNILVPNSIMLIEDFESKYYFTNKFYAETIEKGSVSSIVLYKNNGKYILKDTFSFNNNLVEAYELENQMQ